MIGINHAPGISNSENFLQAFRHENPVGAIAPVPQPFPGGFNNHAQAFLGRLLGQGFVPLLRYILKNAEQPGCVRVAGIFNLTTRHDIADAAVIADHPQFKLERITCCKALADMVTDALPVVRVIDVNGLFNADPLRTALEAVYVENTVGPQDLTAGHIIVPVTGTADGLDLVENCLVAGEPGNGLAF